MDMMKNKLIPFLVSCALAVLSVSGCNFILGPPDDGTSPGPLSGPVRVRYVETLRNQASLAGEPYMQSGVASRPTSSIQRPTSIAADLFRVYVADQAQFPRLAVFDRSARTLTIYSAPTPTAFGERFVDLSSVAVTASGNIFLADAQQGKVFGLDRAGNLLLTIGKAGNLAYPTGLAVDSGRNRLYVVDKHAHAVHIYSMTGEWLQDITGDGAKKRLGSPVAMAIDAEGTCFILDLHGQRIHTFDRDGVYRSSFHIATNVPAEAVRPTGISVDSDGHLYVTDGIGNSILIFDKNGTFLQRWGAIGGQIDGFWSPGAIFIDKRDLIYIADQMNGRIQVYQYVK